MLKPTRIARALTVVLPAGAILLSLPALAAAPSNPAPSTSLFGSDSTPPSDAAPRIKLAGKLSSAVKGAAVGSRAARGSNKSEQQNAAGNDQDAEKESASQKAEPEGDAPASGPFKVVIPSQKVDQKTDQTAGQESPPATAAQATPKPEVKSDPTPALAASPSVAKPAQSIATSPTASGPVRTILDRSGKDQSREPQGSHAAAKPIEIKPAAQKTAIPASNDAADGSCIAGCYAPTSTQLTSPAVRRNATAQQSGAQQAGSMPLTSPTAQTGIECLAGCDGIQGKQLPRATSGAAGPAADQAATASSQSGSNRVVIIRGNTRTKSYGVNQ